MRNKLLFMLAVPFIFAACHKSNDCPYTANTATASAAEVTNLKAWLDTSLLPYTQHPSGIFYRVITQGSGGAPGPCSEVTVKYKGTLTNGVGFDSSYQRAPDGTQFTLGELIPGWQTGIPLIQKGGSIILYIPPSLGYGTQDNRDQNGNIIIPGNSNLVFSIELLNVQ